MNSKKKKIRVGENRKPNTFDILNSQFLIDN